MASLSTPPLNESEGAFLRWLLDAGLWPRVTTHFLNGRDTCAFQFPDNSYHPSRKVQLLYREEFQAKLLAGPPPEGRSVGFYTPNAQNLTRWACLDFDGSAKHSSQYYRAKDAFQWLQAHQCEVLVERSSDFDGRQAYHVWVVWPDFRPAKEARELLNECWRGLNFPDHKPEIFPKVDSVKRTAKGLGNLVRLFGMYHQAKRCWSAVRAVTPGFFDALTTDVPACGKHTVPAAITAGAFPEPERETVYQAVTRNLVIPHPGTRHNLMLKLIQRLQYRQVDPRQADEVHLRWLQENEGQFRTSVHDAVKEFHTSWDYAGRTLNPNGFHPERLTVDPDDPVWQEVYAGLGKWQRQTLDIIRTLPGHVDRFFLSCHDLGKRLGIPHFKAWEVLQSLETRSILTSLNRFPPGSPEFRKKANEYRLSVFDGETDPFRNTV
jgi:hypothetical protein